MTTVFLYCFFVGFGLTLVSAVLGALDISGLGHVGHGDFGAHGGHAGHVGGHGGHAGHVGGHGGPAGHVGGHGGHAGDMGGHAHADLSGAHGENAPQGTVATVSPINFQSLMAFLMGFGGIGFIVSESAWGALIVVLVMAAVGGLGTAWIVLRFMRFLVRGERPLPPTSYVGVTGKLTIGIREGGTGELLYDHHGTRQVLAARSADGRPIARGTQVLVLQYAKGVAYVEPWQDLLHSNSDQA